MSNKGSKQKFVADAYACVQLKRRVHFASKGNICCSSIIGATESILAACVKGKDLYAADKLHKSAILALLELVFCAKFNCSDGILKAVCDQKSQRNCW